MSTYHAPTRHPETGAIESAWWLDDYFGRHQYGVQFPDGKIFTQVEVERGVMSPVELARKVAEDNERKVPRHAPTIPTVGGAYEGEMQRIDHRLDQVIRNSPPPLDDVGGGVEEMLDEKDPQRLILQRQTTHGDFRDNGRVMQGMKEIARSGPMWGGLTPYQREGVEMIIHKLGRIVCGNPNYPDHWDDIAGYAVRVRSFL